MNCRLYLIAFLIVVGLLGCAAAGGLRPTLWTAPPSYLASFPLNTVTESDMFMKAGPPDRTMEIGGKKAYVYQMGKGLGVRTFTYIFDGGVVVEVVYNDGGPYNGITATSEHKK